MILIDAQKEMENYQKKKFRSVLFFSIVSLLVVTLIALGIIFSPRQFLWLLLVLIVLFIAYSVGALIFLIGPFKETTVKAKLFKAIAYSPVREEELTLIKIDDGKLHSYQGLVSLRMTFSYFEEDKPRERTLYVLLPSEAKMEVNKCYRICSSNNLILSQEEVV